MVFRPSMQWLPVLMCLASLLVSIASHGFECKHNNNKIDNGKMRGGERT